MSLLDDVSIVVTPNGYKAGTLFAVKPTIAYGSELVVNGDFSEGDTGWTIEAVWTISGGAAHGNGATGSSQELKQAILEVGKTYEFSYEIRNRVSGSVELLNSGLGSTFSNQVYTSIGIATSTELRFRPSSFNGDIYNVSVREFTGADMDVTRATAATRVDENGLVNYAEVVSDTELVTNGDFATDSDWNLDSSFSISGGLLTQNGTAGRTFQTISALEVGLGTYIKVTFTVEAISSGQFVVSCYGVLSPIVTTTGTYTFSGVTSNTTNLYVNNGGYYANGSISNISVKQSTVDNVPRIDYTGGGCPHILAEPQRTNNIEYSEDFTQSYWRKDKVTVTANSIISPSGQLDASLIQETVYTGGIPSFDLLNSITLGTGSHTFTFYVKNNNGRYLGISFGSNAQRVRTNFDFTTNTFKTLIFNGTTTGSASFTTLGDYYRISITATFPSSTVADTVLMPLATDTYPFYSFQDSDNRSFYLWGTQLEAGSYATSYIPTSGSTVTRNQDQFSRDGITSLINSEEGTLVIEPRYFIDDGSSRKISISDGTGSNRIYITPWQGVASRIRYIFTNGGSTQADLFFSGIDLTVSNKFAFVWATNRFELWQNGVKLSEDTSGTTPSAGTFNQINFGSETGSATELFEGELKQLQVYKTALTDTQLAALTS